MSGHRRSIRHPYHDYRSSSAYFITIVTQAKTARFGKITDGTMHLSSAGEMVYTEWQNLPNRFNAIALDDFVIMPNHLHGILVCGMVQLKGEWVGGEQSNPFVGHVIGAFKSITTNLYILGVKERKWESFEGRLWQRNFYERVVRNEKEFDRIKEYIQTNPLRGQSIGRTETVRVLMSLINGYKSCSHSPEGDHKGRPYHTKD